VQVLPGRILQVTEVEKSGAGDVPLLVGRLITLGFQGAGLFID